jgi:hypothetical protein
MPLQETFAKNGLDTAQARALIEQEKQDRVKRCEAKINQALQEERCGLDVSVIISAKGNFPQLNIFAQD